MAKQGKYQYYIYEKNRGNCIKCKERKTTVLIRLLTPFEKKLWLCHQCLIDYLLEQFEVEQKAEAAKKRIEKKQQELKDRAKYWKDHSPLKQLSSIERKVKSG